MLLKKLPTRQYVCLQVEEAHGVTPQDLCLVITKSQDPFIEGVWVGRGRLGGLSVWGMLGIGTPEERFDEACRRLKILVQMGLMGFSSLGIAGTPREGRSPDETEVAV